MMIQDLATQAIDYKAVFKQSPGVAYLMSPSFEILDVSDGAVGLTGRDRRDLIGRKFFDAFPANPRASEDSGPRKLRAELARAVRSGDRAVMNLNQYDVEDPGRGPRHHADRQPVLGAGSDARLAPATEAAVSALPLAAGRGVPGGR